MNRSSQLLLLATPLWSSAAIFAFPAQAATLSLSQTFLGLSFNQSPLSNETTDNITQIAVSGSEISQVNPRVSGGVDFVVDEAQTFTQIRFQNQVAGEGDRYFGLSQASGQSVGEFFIEADQVFSFDFLANLTLSNTVSDSLTDSVTTISNLSFSLVDTFAQNIGNFQLLGNLETNLLNEDDDFLDVDRNGNIVFTNSPTPLITEQANQESVSITFSGTFQQRFEQPTQLRLTASTMNKTCAQAPQAEDACVKVPEQSSIWALLGFVGVGLLSGLRRNFFAS
ncbi:MAG: hypothetical protein ACFB4I_10900 [Cyanophyceae cyanobacterium]